ncbi:hypothetical protein AMTRI_Chr11g150020 [Amborella trichopoda]
MKILEVILTLKSSKEHHETRWPNKFYAVLSVQQAKLKTKMIKTNQDDFAWKGKFVFQVEENFLIKPDAFLNLKIYRPRRLLGNELLGYARTPASGVMGFEGWGFSSLPVSGRSDMPLGLVNFGLVLWPARHATMEFLKEKGGMEIYGL